MAGGNPILSAQASAPPKSGDAFLQLVQGISAKASEVPGSHALMQFFCQATRAFFRCAGVYFWRLNTAGELVGELAEGKLSESFQGIRLLAHESVLTAEAVRSRRTLFTNQVPNSLVRSLQPFHARALMAAPVVVFHEVIGAMSFLHDSEGRGFNEESASHATILVGQLGSLMEVTQRRRAWSEDRPGEGKDRSSEDQLRENARGASEGQAHDYRAPEGRAHEDRAQVDHARDHRTQQDQAREERVLGDSGSEETSALQATPDIDSVVEALADRLRMLLRTRLVSVLLRQEGPYELRAVSAETPQLATSFRARHDRHTIRFAADLAQRAIAAGETISVSVSSDQHSLGNVISSGIMLAAPFRASRTQGAILVYPRAEGGFTAQEKSLVATVAGFGAVALAHAELCCTAQSQVRELQQLLEIASEFNSRGDLEHLLQVIVVRAADFLGFGRCFVALLEEDRFHIRHSMVHGHSRRCDEIFPEGATTGTMRRKEVFWSDDWTRESGADLEAVERRPGGPLLAAPLLGADGSLLGMLGMLERLEGASISREDIRRARELAAKAAAVLEAARNRQQAEVRRRRSETLGQLSRELDAVLRLPDFASKLLDRALALMAARAGGLVLLQEGKFQTVALQLLARNPKELGQNHGQSDVGREREPPEPDHSSAIGNRHGHEGDRLQRLFAQIIGELAGRTAETVVSGDAADLLGSDLASTLGWGECLLVRLLTSGGELSGLLCLAGRSRALAPEDRELLEALAGHAATALDNARRFSQMEQANRHWMEIFDAITDLIVVHDEADNVLRVNRSLAAMIGVAPQELIGVNMRALMALTSESQLYSCPFCRSLGEGADEFVHPALDRTYLVSTSRAHGAAGERLQTIHVLKDITDRREAERRYHELFDNIQEGLFFSTPEGRFIEVNDALVNMLGYSSREELLQVDIPTQVYFTPEQRVLQGKEMEEKGYLRNFESRLRRKNGSPVYVLINAFGMYDSLGGLAQIRGVMLDVTGLHTYQSELQRERDFSGKILSNTQSLILVADTAGLISYANRRWHDAGFEQRELLGRPLLQLAAPGFVRPLSDALQSVLRGEQVDNLEVQIMRGNGHAGHFSVNLSPMRDEQGNINSIVVVMTDITDSSELRDKLVHAEKLAAVGQLVSGVAHEVNNPLTAILGFADLLLGNPDIPENARKDLRVILQEAQRTKTIVQNLLSFARQMPPQRHSVQLNLILRRTIQLRSYDFNSHGVDIVEHLDEGLPDVHGDPHQLQQVFLNILNNAYDAVHDIGRPPRIEIMSTKAGNSVEVSFRDNGPGIAHPDRIFNPFFTTKEVGKGTGLGLSICYGIVKEHGGEILCHNNTDGQGATFIVRFPAAPHTASLGVAAGVLQP
jgi:two-component system NtrC family sensor kinase